MRHVVRNVPALQESLNISQPDLPEYWLTLLPHRLLRATAVRTDADLSLTNRMTPALRDALVQLRDDLALRQSLSARALVVAKENHNASRIAPAFLEQNEFARFDRTGGMRLERLER